MSDARRLRLEVVLQAVDKATRPLQRLLGANKDLARAVKQGRDQLSALNREQKRLDGFRELKSGIKESGIEMRNATAKAEALRKQLDTVQGGAARKKAIDEQLKSLRALEAQLDKATVAMNKRARLAGKTAYVDGERDAFLKLQEETGNTLRQINRLKAEQKALATQTPVNTEQLKKLSRQYKEAKATADKLTQAHRTKLGTFRQMRSELLEAGIRTKEFSRHEADLKARIDATKQALREKEAALTRMAERQRHLAAAQGQYQRGMANRNAMLGTGVSLMGAGAVTLAPVAKTVKDYVAFEDAMLGIARQVDGARDAGGKLTPVYYDMARQIKQLGTELPIPVTQIAEMVTAGARMEVPRHELIDYTRTVAMMATAFDAVPDEIAESMGKVAKNFRIPTNAIMGLADTINYLDDNAISKGNDIIDVLNRTSGVVSTVAMSAKDAAALGSTLLTLGERTETAGTAINAIIQKFAAADKGTKKFRSAVEEIGLTSAQVQRGMATDATGTLFRVIEAIKRLPEDKRIGVMVELVGLEHSDTLAKLVDKPDELQRQIGLANGNQAQGSMSREFSARQDTISAHWQRLQNRIFNTSSEGGGGLRATIIDLIDSTGRLLERFDTFAKNNPGLVSGLLKAAAAVGALLLAAGGLTLSMAAMHGPIVIARYGLRLLKTRAGRLASGFKLLKAGIGKVGTALKWIGRLALANPILATIAVIATAAFLIWDNWETLGPKIEGLWQDIKGACSSAWDGIKNTWNAFWQDMDALANDGTVNVNATLLKWSPITPIKAVFLAVWDFFVPEQFQQFGSNIIQGIIDGLFSKFPVLKDAVSKITGWFKSVFGDDTLAQAPAVKASQIDAALPKPAKAGATKLAAIGTAIAIGTAPAMAAPVSFDTRPAMTARSTGIAPAPAPITIHIHPPAGADPQAIARLVRDELRQIENQRAARQRSRLADRD
ncbi:phage tail tape measure protein [Ralstonia wenshanensis]|uniref:phage tail tape measure protein n=1 Tax=Ralstonia wenshanensis TaxID=2842456 RepID=UPI001E5B0B67|nr:phage tail tape measure protein [Ralstonia wenshanensis]UGS89805.1 phage tail tape measure protein [Ralstonia wenshanensis]